MKVRIESEDDLKCCLDYATDNGIHWAGGQQPFNYEPSRSFPYSLNVDIYLSCDDIRHAESTLAEFKKEQGIMKYSAGDVLENGDYTETIQGIIGDIYLTIDNKGIASMFTDVTFARDEYTLKTETIKTDMSVSEIEKALGKAAGSLNVVAE